jgi:hypothetical protein
MTLFMKKEKEKDKKVCSKITFYFPGKVGLCYGLNEVCPFQNSC